jgi:hypothetical protein
MAAGVSFFFVCIVCVVTLLACGSLCLIYWVPEAGDQVGYGINSLSSLLTKQSPKEMEIIFVNAFPTDVALYYDDGEAGMYLFTLPAHGESTVEAYIDQTFYATNTTSGEKLISVTVSRDVIKYVLQHVSRIASTQLNFHHVTRSHPVIQPLNVGHSKAAFVKFRSLSGRALELWFDDGRDGIFEGLLNPGQVTTTNAYQGHVFIIKVHGHKEIEVCRVKIVPNKVSI